MDQKFRETCKIFKCKCCKSKFVSNHVLYVFPISKIPYLRAIPAKLDKSCYNSNDNFFDPFRFFKFTNFIASTCKSCWTLFNSSFFCFPSNIFSTICSSFLQSNYTFCCDLAHQNSSTQRLNMIDYMKQQLALK